MELHVDTRQLNLAFDLTKDLQENNFEYIYRGQFTNSINSNILSLTETKLEKGDDTMKLKKKIYFIIVECLQNITRHQDFKMDSDQQGIFVIQKTATQFVITTGNLMHTDKVENLRNNLSKITRLDKDELRNHYQQMLVNGEISDKGGAGLGLIAMARKTDNQIFYDFQKADEEYSFFYLRTLIPLDPTIILSDNDLDIAKSFDKTKEIHNVLNRENILLNFNGSFNQENLETLLPIVKEQTKGPINVEERLFKIMFEMLQNIVNYAENNKQNINNINGGPGIFLLSYRNGKFYLTAGNYLENNKIRTLQKKIDFTNSMSNHDLQDFYNKLALFFKRGEIKKPDLSIIEMRLRSENNLNYCFYTFDHSYSFFSIQTVIQNGKPH